MVFGAHNAVKLGRLQSAIRFIRTHRPRININRFTWLRLRWKLEKFFAETAPLPAPLINPKLLNMPAWTEADERRQVRMWYESEFRAFWLHPDGPEAGIKVLNDEKLFKHHAETYRALILREETAMKAAQQDTEIAMRELEIEAELKRAEARRNYGLEAVKSGRNKIGDIKRCSSCGAVHVKLRPPAMRQDEVEGPSLCSFCVGKILTKTLPDKVANQHKPKPGSKRYLVQDPWFTGLSTNRVNEFDSRKAAEDYIKKLSRRNDIF